MSHAQPSLGTEPIAHFRARFLDLRAAIGQVIIGRDEAVLGILAALVSGGHALLEGPPGTGKTLLAKTVARLTGLAFARIQFTPDLLPADILGGEVLRRGEGGIEQTEFRPGPIFANVVLADELNRASPRTQAALLEAMEERQVTTRDGTLALAEPFVVLATQNPLDQGTYPLPESQLDRFLVRLDLAGPSQDELVSILAGDPAGKVGALAPVIDRDGLLELRAIAAEVVCAPEVLALIAAAVRATDPSGDSAPASIRARVRAGVSARGARSLLACARVRAAASGRAYVSADDVEAMARPVFAHRLVLDFGAGDGAEIRAELVADALRVAKKRA